MAEPSETPPGNTKNNSHCITTIQPTTKLGGRGTPRRKARRPNSNNYSALIAARTIENKLKPFRTQFQLQDQQELCDITILYDDGRVEIQKQVHVHSTWPMTIHEIDSSETGIQTYYINDIDSANSEYLFGNIDNLQDEFNNQQSIPITKSTNYYNDLQQSQSYSQPSRYYMNYVAYQQNPYAINSYDTYSQNIQQVYGGVNTQSDAENENDNDNQEIIKTSRRKRRRRKHTKPTSEQEQLLTEPPKQEQEEEEDEVTIDKPIEQTENGNGTTIKPKHKRRRIRKSKKSLPSSSPAQEQSQTSQAEIDLTPSINNEQNNQDILLSSAPPTQHAEFEETQQLTSTKNGIHANRKAFTKDVMNVIQNDGRKKNEGGGEEKEIQPTTILPRVDDIIPTILTRIPTVVVDDVDNKTEDENEKITHSVTEDASITTTSSPSIIISNKPSNEHILLGKFNIQKQPSSDPIQVNISFFINK